VTLASRPPHCKGRPAAAPAGTGSHADDASLVGVPEPINSGTGRSGLIQPSRGGMPFNGA
jgi:hypothetical protein